MAEKEISCVQEEGRTIEWYKVQLMKMRKLYSELQIELDKLDTLRKSVAYFALKRRHCQDVVFTEGDGSVVECDGIVQGSEGESIVLSDRCEPMLQETAAETF